MRAPSLLLLLLLPVVLAGCAARDAPVQVRGGAGIEVVQEGGAFNVSLSPRVQAEAVQVCAGACDASRAAAGAVVAEGGLSSLRNLSLNAAGPDGDSAILFFDGGQGTGRFIRWTDAVSRFQVNADVQVVGNLTATGHVGTTTPLVLDGRVFTLSTAALEGTEQAVYYRGSGVIVNGTYVLNVPPELQAIARLDEGLVTVQATLTSDGPALFVAEKSATRIVFRATGGSNVSGVTFDYFVQAGRRGGEGFQL